MDIAIEHELQHMPVEITNIISNYAYMTAAEILISLEHTEQWKITYISTSCILAAIAYSAEHDVFSWSTSDIHPEREYVVRMNTYTPAQLDEIIENRTLDCCFEQWLEDGASDSRWDVDAYRMRAVRYAYGSVIDKLLQLVIGVWLNTTRQAELLYPARNHKK